MERQCLGLLAAERTVLVPSFSFPLAGELLLLYTGTERLNSLATIGH